MNVPELLDCASLAPADAVRLGELLRATPATWPDDLPSRARAEEIVGGRCPEPSLGTTLLLTALPHGDSGHLWLLSDAETPGAAPFGPDAERAWAHAALALTRSLPFLWGRVRDARDLSKRRALFLNSVSAGAVCPPNPRLVDGPSLGLSLLLAMASRALGIPVPSSVAASAAIDPNGHLSPVEGLPEKVRALLATAPGVRTLLVHPGDAGLARRLVGTRLEVVPVDSAADAVSHVWPNIEELLVKVGATAEQRQEITGALFHLSLSGRDVAASWQPITRTCDLALHSWRQLEDDLRQSLLFVRAVAARHDDNQPVDELPSPEWVSRQPDFLRLRILANLVQGSSDTAKPPPEWSRTMAEANLPRPEDPQALHPVHLELLGAYGRLLAVVGEPQRALEIQERATEHWIRLLDYGGTTYSLSAWYRLAGALGDRASLARADQTFDRLVGVAGPVVSESAYVTLARASARIAMGDASRLRQDSAELARLVQRPSTPHHVRWSAARRLLAAARMDPAVDSAKTRQDLLEGPLQDEMAVYRWLAQLDQALATGQHALAENLVAAPPADKPIVAMLTAWAPTGHVAEHVTRFFAY